jgi:glycosyltransferase involved in cell wall biosynthesis
VLIDPGSVAENVEAIEAVLEDARLRNSMRDSGPQRAARFTWTASAAQLREIYSSLL